MVSKVSLVEHYYWVMIWILTRCPIQNLTLCIPTEVCIKINQLNKFTLRAFIYSSNLLTLILSLSLSLVAFLAICLTHQSSFTDCIKNWTIWISWTQDKFEFCEYNFASIITSWLTGLSLWIHSIFYLPVW